MWIVAFLVFVLSVVTPLNAYYHRLEKRDADRHQDQIILNSRDIEVKGATDELFPNELTLNVKIITPNGEKLSVAFVKVDDSPTDNVLVQEQNEIVKKAFNKSTEYRLYKERFGTAVLTLIRNSEDNQYPYRILATLLINNQQIDIVPIKLDSQDNEQYHVIYKNNPNELLRFDDHGMIPPAGKLKYKRGVALNERKKRRQKRADALKLYVETLIVIDSSAYEKYKALFSALNDDLLTDYLRIHFYHAVNAADLRYTNSLQSDTELNINLRLAGILIYTNADDTPWTSFANVGVSGYETYNGKGVVNSGLGLTVFSNTMKSKSVSIDYDHAVAIVNKDLWSSNNTLTAAQRTGVIGLAWLTGVCSTDYKYSIIEELGMDLIVTIAHEIGHSLGAYHDGSGSSTGCAASDNYIMTPYVGSRSNIANTFVFSSCSITEFKSFLMSSGSVSTAGSCLTNEPSALSNIYFNNEYLAGQLWNLDQQCKLIQGSSSSFCASSSISLCQSITCYDSTDSCVYIPGWGAIDGTVCDTDKVCYKTQCVDKSTVNTKTLATSICSTNPCLNGGICLTVNSFYLCQCNTGYTGLNCETQTNVTAATTKSTTTKKSASLSNSSPNILTFFLACILSIRFLL